ncbi:MAG TPA: glycerol-3-phosphate dehydrogenase/oxidase [Myxococcota bacterium]|jgi:glycerol-3-phosphate dehydrogenase|nr:glycerol-3-phosphate dehydrogenase/oxidase [Myxococcota bacterium]
MQREAMLGRLAGGSFDVIVIGGGASGLGVAVDAATRGYRTLLLEQCDFAKGTSSRSTKLVHGGVRYLQQGNIALVLEALRERGLMRRNAPHLVRDLAFVVPSYRWWEGPFYGIGLKVYDALARKLNLGPSRHLGRDETLARIPNAQPEGLLGGTLYYDGQFDDARMAITLARTAAEHGAVLLNYVRVVGLLKARGFVAGVRARDEETGEELEIPAKVVVNATGVFADAVRRMDDTDAPAALEPSQGVHLVLPRDFQPSDTALMVPHTDDGRVLFVIPWHGRCVLGTTDTPTAGPVLEPRAREDEIDFILRNAARYLARDPRRSDVLSIFAGLRPLARASVSEKTKSLSRDHSVLVSATGLVTLIGGKWTTYRKMAQDTVDDAASIAGLDDVPCRTERLDLHGFMARDDPDFPAEDHWQAYGSEARAVCALSSREPALAAPLHPRLPYQGVHVAWAVRHEMARTVEDVLSRRTRSLLLDARAALEAAPAVAKLVARELGRDALWEKEQLESFAALVKTYLPE